MPTISDIAKAAGVSQGTVSNVLNGRNNVSSEKIKLVLDACEKLKYIPNERARALRRGKDKSLGVVLSNLSKKSECDFFLGFKAYANTHGYVTRQYLPSTVGTKAEINVLRMAKSDMTSGIAIFSNCLNTHSSESLQNTIYVERRSKNNACYIGFDYKTAGRDMAKRIIDKKYSSVTLLMGSKRYTNEMEFADEFISTLSKQKCRVNIVHTDHVHVPLNILQLAEENITEAFVCTQLEFAQSLKKTLNTFYSGKSTDIYTLSPTCTLPEFEFIRYELNYRLLGNLAAKALINSIEKNAKENNIILKNSGFRSWDACNITLSNKPINIVTLDSPSAYSLKHMSKLYTRQTGKQVNIDVYAYDQLYDVYINIDKKYDIIRIDETWLSWFASKILMPLCDIDASITSYIDTFLDGTAEHYCFVNDILYALPGSPSSQVLFYRKDIFEAPIYRRLFHEQYKTELKPPSTFDEFNRIAKFFTKSENSMSEVKYGATMTLGSTGVAGSEYLARLFAMQENVYNDKGIVELNSDIAVRALEQLIELKKYSSPSFCNWWTDTAKAFASGNFAMSIIYNNFAVPLVDRHSNVVDNIGYAMVPGGRPVLGGGSLGISKYSSNPQDALHFIRWILSEPVASASTLLGGVSPCKASMENYKIINSYPWLRLVKRCFINSQGKRQVASDKRPFNEKRFIGLIGQAVKSAYNGEFTCKEAMDNVQLAFENELK